MTERAGEQTGDRLLHGRRLVRLDPMRAAIARRMTDSKQQIPHFYVSAEITVDPLLKALAQLNAERASAARVTVTAAVIGALSTVLSEEPEFNARWSEEGLELHAQRNIGVAIPVDGGLVAPAILRADELDLGQIADALVDLTERARTGRLRGRELTDGTFTLTNLGMHNVSSFAAIIVPPQVAILALGRAAERAIVVDGEVVARRVMTATLSSDHRAVDGVAAARFLARLRDRLMTSPKWIAVADKPGEKS